MHEKSMKNNADFPCFSSPTPELMCIQNAVSNKSNIYLTYKIKPYEENPNLG
jgi:hypothetical protein